MIGGLHTAKILALSRHSRSTEYIPLPGQPLSSDTVTNLEEKMGLYNLGEKDILYIDLFSNSIFTGSVDYGLPVPTFKNSSGTYHMTGCLEVAPEAVLRKRFSLVCRVLDAAGTATIICALALPRYVKRPCLFGQGLSQLPDLSSLSVLSTVPSPPRSYLRTDCPAQLILIRCVLAGQQSGWEQCSCVSGC